MVKSYHEFLVLLHPQCIQSFSNLDDADHTIGNRRGVNLGLKKKNLLSTVS